MEMAKCAGTFRHRGQHGQWLQARTERRVREDVVGSVSGEIK